MDGKFTIHPNNRIRFLYFFHAIEPAIYYRRFSRSLCHFLHTVKPYHDALWIQFFYELIHCHYRVRVGCFLACIFQDVKPHIAADDKVCFAFCQFKCVRPVPCECIQLSIIGMKQHIFQAIPNQWFEHFWCYIFLCRILCILA